MKDGLDLSKFVIIPTGDEILNGTVLDTNSPAIMSIIIRNYPDSEVIKLKPVIDSTNSLEGTLDLIMKEDVFMMIYIGGSGGGHRFVKSLAVDCVSDFLQNNCEYYSAQEIYGNNGHLWSKLVVGKIKNTWVFNVPGPHKEAVASVSAFFKSFEETTDLKVIVENVSNAVKKLYG